MMPRGWSGQSSCLMHVYTLMMSCGTICAYDVIQRYCCDNLAMSAHRMWSAATLHSACLSGKVLSIQTEALQGLITTLKVHNSSSIEFTCK